MTPIVPGCFSIFAPSPSGDANLLPLPFRLSSRVPVSRLTLPKTRPSSLLAAPGKQGKSYYKHKTSLAGTTSSSLTGQLCAGSISCSCRRTFFPFPVHVSIPHPTSSQLDIRPAHTSSPSHPFACFCSETSTHTSKLHAHQACFPLFQFQHPSIVLETGSTPLIGRLTSVISLRLILAFPARKLQPQDCGRKERPTLYQIWHI